MTEQLNKKVQQAIKLLQAMAPKDGSPIEVAYSGGKDSDVILQLAKESGINYRAIYKNTTIDPPRTIAHVKEMGVEIVRPEKNFFQLLEIHGNPSRYYRFCCTHLKEYQYDKTMSRTIIGVRKAESRKRAKRYNEPTECLGTKKQPYEAVYPLLDWTDEDVRDFILDRGIKCAPVYYDESGNFHVERRLGCMCCPLQGEKKRVGEFKARPRMLRQYIRHLQKYMDTHPEAKFTKLYEGDACMAMVRTLFYPQLNSHHFADYFNNGLFEKPNYKEYLERVFNIKL